MWHEEARSIDSTPPPSGWNVSPSQVIALQRSVKLLQHSLELIYTPGLREALKESDDLAKEHKKGPKRGLEFLIQIPAHDALRHLRFPLERKGYTEIFLNLLKLKMVFQHVKIKIHSTIYTVKKVHFKPQIYDFKQYLLHDWQQMLCSEGHNPCLANAGQDDTASLQAVGKTSKEEHGWLIRFFSIMLFQRMRGFF